MDVLANGLSLCQSFPYNNVHVKAVKGQSKVDFLSEHPWCGQENDNLCVNKTSTPLF